MKLILWKQRQTSVLFSFCPSVSLAGMESQHSHYCTQFTNSVKLKVLKLRAWPEFGFEG